MSRNIFSTCLLATGLLFSPALAAELFKWVDENGNVHFSDTKPEQAAAETTTIPVDQVSTEARDANGTHYARIHKPIENSSGSSRSLELIGVSFDRDRILGKGFVGKAFSGKQCKAFGNHYVLQHGEIPAIIDKIKVYFLHSLKRYGYTLFKGNEQRSFLSFGKGADYSLRVVLNDIEINSCRRKYIAVHKHNLSSYYRATWTLFDNKTGKVAYQGETKGYDSGLYFATEVRNKGMQESSTKSIQNMIGNLFADKQFVSKLLTDALP